MDFFEEMEARIPKGKVRTRFAPSPTGYMHVGNLRTALYTWLIARRYGGKFILRIEDTDQGRLIEGATDVIYRTMAECGLTHDEGPDVGGPVGPYIQSQRRDLFGKYAKLLCKKGGAYYIVTDRWQKFTDVKPLSTPSTIKVLNTWPLTFVSLRVILRTTQSKLLSQIVQTFAFLVYSGTQNFS